MALYMYVVCAVLFAVAVMSADSALPPDKEETYECYECGEMDKGCADPFDKSAVKNTCDGPQCFKSASSALCKSNLRYQYIGKSVSS